MTDEDESRGRGVVLSSDQLRTAVHLLELLTSGQGPEPTRMPPISREALLRIAKFSLLARQGRTAFFSRAMFGEPAWDLLLNLYIAESSGTADSVSSLARSADIPVTTALRWIEYLEKKRFVERQQSDADRRLSMVKLTETTRERLERYFADVLMRITSSGLDIAAVV